MGEMVIYAILMMTMMFVFFIFLIVLFRTFYHKVPLGKALIINTMNTRQQVTFTGGMVMPVIHRAEVLDITMKQVTVELRGEEAARSADGLPIDLALTFQVKVNETEDDVLKVASSFGVERASDPAAVQAHFGSKFADAARNACAKLDYYTLYHQLDTFRDAVIELTGRELNGFALEEMSVDLLSMTPDPANPGPGFSARLALDAAVSERLAAALSLPAGQALLKRLAAEDIAPADAAMEALALANKSS